MNKNQFKSELIFELLLFIVFNLFYFTLFTPPSNIVFFSIDTRMMSDEIIQILKPSSFYDFIYDVAYGGRIIWGRFFHYFYAPIVFTLNLIFGNYLSLTQIIILINYNFLFLGLVILGRIYIKSNLFRYSIISLLLTFEISSIIDLKTTSQEIFITSLIIYFLNKDPELLNKQQLAITAFLAGILCGIKFTNAPYAIVLLLYLMYKKNQHIFIYVFSSVAGFITAQPSLLIPKVLDLYIDDIFHHLKYNESKVTNFDWLEIIYVNYGRTFLIFFIILVIISIKNFNLITSTYVIFVAAFVQLVSYFFSNGLIRAHYTKLPIILLFFYLFNIVERNKYKTTMNFFIFIYIFIGIYDNFQKSYEINLYKYKSIEKIDNMYENKPEVILMYEVFEFVEQYSKENNIPLVWWSEGTRYYPYSDFHWTSYEEPKNYNFYIKEMFERFEGFVKGECSNYGGIAVNYKDSIDLELEKILLEKDFKFVKQFNQNSGDGNYFYRIYAAVQSGIPNDC